MWTRIALIAVGWCFTTSGAFASPVDDFYIQQALDRYFSLPRDPKSLATAGSSAMTCSGGACMFMNPAGLGAMRDVEITAAVGAGTRTGDDLIVSEDIETDGRDGYLVLAVPLGTDAKYGVLSLGYSRYAASTDDVIGNQPDGHRRSIAYGIGDSELSAGYAFHFYDDQLRSDLYDLHSHSRFLHVFAAQAALSSDTHAGAVFRLGIGQSDTEYFPTMADGLSHLREYSFTAGVSHDVGGATLFGSLDYTFNESNGNLNDFGEEVVIGGDEDGESWGPRFGAQAHIVDIVAVRGGFRWYAADYEFHREELSRLSGRLDGWGFSTGLAIFFDPVRKESGPRIEYGVEYFTPGHGAWNHLLSLSVPL